MDHEANRERVKAALGVEAEFNMEYWWDKIDEYYDGPETTCGTAGCIGGTAEHLMRSDGVYVGSEDQCTPTIATWLGMETAAAHELFYDDLACDNTTTVEQACQAIDNAAKFADPKWGEVLFG